MKYLAIIFVIALGFAGYRIHLQKLKETQEAAELTAYNQTKAQIEQERAAQEEKARREAAARAVRPEMAISKALEPLVQQVEAPLNLKEPADLQPLVEGTKQRILEKRVNVEPARALVFDRGTAVLNYLAAVADERTKALKSMIHDRSASSTSLNRADAANFFNQGVTKRWDDTLVRARPAVNQLMEQLRAAEREWNKQARQGGAPEQYDLEGLTPTMIPFDPPAQVSTPSTVSRVIRRATPAFGPNGQPIP
jgi:hypothetical protein